ncbi:MAG: sulfotransferase [Coleofasciculus sp. D1-CHI-01]|uniref:hypothetical protein n=1 Tax=Coleofasciculus sp. D1-CHI-01 TaxID=3068482 RepID=UPI0032FC603E
MIKSASAKYFNFIDNPRRSLSSLCYRVQNSWRCYTSQINPNPIFVFGNQKSGTSAVTALLGEATNLTYCVDILCFFGDMEEKLLKREYSFDEIVNKSKYYFSKDIIKDPTFTFFVNKTTLRFPSAKKIFVLRDPRSNIRSILNRLDIPGNLNDLHLNLWHKLREKFPYNWYHVLDGTLLKHKGRDYIETLALRCKKVLQFYIANQSNFTAIKYENFQANKVSEIESLASRLELKIVNNINPIKNVQFQPKGKSSISLIDFFGSSNLRKIEEICREEMSILDYY